MWLTKSESTQQPKGLRVSADLLAAGLRTRLAWKHKCFLFRASIFSPEVFKGLDGWCLSYGYHSPLSKAYWLKWRAHLNPSPASSSKPGQDGTRHHPPQPMIPSLQAESIQELVTLLQMLPFYRVVCLSMGLPDLSIALPGKESAHTPSSSHNVKMFPWIKWSSKDFLARCSEVSI